MSIYVKYGRKKSIKEFLIEFFKSEKRNGYLTNVTTYKNSECTTVQCDEGKYRSFDEILELVNTYYKNVSAKKLINILYNLELINSKGNIKRFYSLYCRDVKKSVILYAFNYLNLSSDNEKEKCKYSCLELKQMIKNK